VQYTDLCSQWAPFLFLADMVTVHLATLDVGTIAEDHFAFIYMRSLRDEELKGKVCFTANESHSFSCVILK